MIILEAAAFAIVALFVVVRARVDADPAAVLARLAALAVAAFIAEDSSIRLYGWYTYDARWSLFVDKVPLAIIVIWPVVIHSAWDMARATAPRHTVLVATLIVLADASLIEPVSVAASLWSWSHEGPFHVPMLGVLGWSFFAVGALWALQRRAVLALVIGPVTTHVLLLAAWWGFFKHAPVVTATWPFVVAALASSVALAVHIARARLSTRVTRTQMFLRVPAAAFFFVLLAVYARGSPALLVYALAFAPPYLVLTPWRGP